MPADVQTQTTLLFSKLVLTEAGIAINPAQLYPPNRYVGL